MSLQICSFPKLSFRRPIKLDCKNMSAYQLDLNSAAKSRSVFGESINMY